eukprot:13561985-Alexandrium_andersonii.AAC.1
MGGELYEHVHVCSLDLARCKRVLAGVLHIEEPGREHEGRAPHANTQAPHAQFILKHLKLLFPGGTRHRPIVQEVGEEASDCRPR